MSGGIRISSPGKAGTGASATTASGSAFLMAGGGATAVALGTAQDASAIASSAQVVIFEMTMMNSRNATPQESRLRSPAQGRSACEHGLRWEAKRHTASMSVRFQPPGLSPTFGLAVENRRHAAEESKAVWRFASHRSPHLFLTQAGGFRRLVLASPHARRVHLGP
jgi:hypothetical protein